MLLKLPANSHLLLALYIGTYDSVIYDTDSPLLGALYLKACDDTFNKQGLYYVRYMDDILILTKTRWHNRRWSDTLIRYLTS
jgi:hypothetical protein